MSLKSKRRFSKIGSALKNASDQASRRSDLVFAETFADLNAWSVTGTPTNGTATVDSGVLTIDDTASGGNINVIAASTVLKNRTKPYAVELTVSHDSAVKLRCALVTGSSAAGAHVELENNTITSLFQADAGYPTPTSVTPAGYLKSNKSRLIFIIDPLRKTAKIYLYYKDSSNDDQFAKLRAGTYTEEIEKIQFLTGGASTGACTIEDIRVYDMWAVMIGDSIAAGHPYYDPVPSFYVSPDETSQVQYGLEQHAGGVRRVHNQGQGGGTVTDVAARNSDFVLDFLPEIAIYWCGTNDLGNGEQPEDVLAELVAVWDETLAAGIRVVHVETMPRNLFTSQQKANILTFNALLDKAAKERNVHFVKVYDALEDPDTAGNIHPDLTGDNVHLNANGYNLVADLVWKEISEFAA